MSLLPQHHQQLILDRPPPYAPDQDDLKLPSVPSSETLARMSNDLPHLPALEPTPSINSTYSYPDVPRHPDYKNRNSRSRQSWSSTSSLPLKFPQPPSHAPGEAYSLSETASAMSIEDGLTRKDTNTSFDDADDRMAAEALCGLGKFGSNSSEQSDPPSRRTTANGDQTPRGPTDSNQEPLLSLITTSHPWLGGTINGSLSAYEATKSHSPRFIQYGADFVERNIGTPVASTVGTVGRKTGVEGSIRRYFDSRRPSELERIDPDLLNEGVTKKRKIGSLNVDGDGERRDALQEGDVRRASMGASVDSLPTYDDNRSPSYEEAISPSIQKIRRPITDRSWSAQLMISTSGLGAALSDNSLQSLRYCLGNLRLANRHVASLMLALKELLRDYDQVPSNLESGVSVADRNLKDLSNQDTIMTDAARHNSLDPASTIAQRIRSISDEIWATMQNVVVTVSRYTGGALPENVSRFVKSQLMSVPNRWHAIISRQQGAHQQQQQNQTAVVVADDAVSGAHRMLAFAMEGLDMMEQVGGAVDSTIQSAEKWLETMGRRRGDEALAAVEGERHREDEKEERDGVQ